MIALRMLPRLVSRNGARLALAGASLTVGALTLATVLGLIGSVRNFFVTESRTLLGGDLSIESDAPVARSTDILSELVSRGARLSERMDTLAVIQSERPPIAGRLPTLLTSLKVVDDAYPLYGTLGTRLDGKTVPASEEAFVAPDVLERMGIVLGDTIVIGSGRFIVANVVEREPDRVAGSFRFGPLVLLSMEGWKRTGIDGKQSRVNHILSIRYPDGFSEEESLGIVSRLREAYPRPTYRISIASDGPSSLLRVLDSAERFFFTMIVLALFLVVVNIRVNLVYFLASFQRTIAIFRALGMRRRSLFALFLSLLALLAFLSGTLGGLLGNVAANAALPLAERFVESPLPPIPLFANMPIVVAFTLALCFLSALGFLVRVAAVEPKLLLLGYGSSHGAFSALLRELPTLVLTLLGLFLGILYLTKRPLVAAIAVAVIAVTFALLYALARGGISLGYRLRQRLPFRLRSVFAFLKNQGVVGTTAIASLTIALTSVFSIALVERNVLGNLRAEFRDDAPNIYLIDIQPEQLDWVRKTMGPSWEDFSIVRARFMERDGIDIQANSTNEDPELRREFNLTARKELIKGERLIGGTWHGSTGRSEVSVEKDFAARAKLALGSRVVFSAQGFPIEATVTSIREVTTTSGLPFFFLVFSPDVLERFPKTSFGYAYVPEAEIPLIQNRLAERYPNISSIPTTQILETVGRVVAALSAAVIATAIPALLLGFILIIAMLSLAARERANDMLVFTAFGARLPLLFSLFLIESATVIAVSGVFASILSVAAVYALNRFVFDFTGFYPSFEAVVIYLAVFLGTMFVAYFYARGFTRRTPAELLRKN
jgi:putative ABC transport system permease protein